MATLVQKNYILFLQIQCWIYKQKYTGFAATALLCLTVTYCGYCQQTLEKYLLLGMCLNLFFLALFFSVFT